MNPTYHLNEDGTLDEIFAGPVHIEQMDDNHWWIGIALPNGETLHVNFWTPRAKIRASYLEGSIIEGGEFSSGIRVPEHERVKRT